MGELMRGKSADIRSPAKKQWGGGGAAMERGAAKKGGHSANQTYSYPWASYTIFTPQGKYYQSNQIK